MRIRLYLVLLSKIMEFFLFKSGQSSQVKIDHQCSGGGVPGVPINLSLTLTEPKSEILLVRSVHTEATSLMFAENIVSDVAKMAGLPITNLAVCYIAFTFTFRIIQCELTLGANRKPNACNIFLALHFSARRTLWPLKENFSAGNIDTRNKVRNSSSGRCGEG